LICPYSLNKTEVMVAMTVEEFVVEEFQGGRKEFGASFH
jgi:hypothetical protein